MDALLLIEPLYVFYAFAALAAILGVEAAYLVFSDGQAYRTQVNRRLEISKKDSNRERVMLQLRRERGLSASGKGPTPIPWFNELIIQSGWNVTLPKALLMMVAFGLVVFCGLMLWRGHLIEAGPAAAIAAFGGPLFLLIRARKKRQALFSEQFPEAIDVIVRSLRAGHPIPVAIAMVAKEQPDPVGSEFGMAADEITYGSDLETAMRQIMDRVGQEDLPLFITSVSIQASTGGNLSQILDNLSKVIRERFKMRRKIKGLSAEGRVSALILNLTPLIIFTVVNLLSPDFYDEVWQSEGAKMVLGGVMVWMGIGNIIMRRMINFKF